MPGKDDREGGFLSSFLLRILTVWVIISHIHLCNLNHISNKYSLQNSILNVEEIPLLCGIVHQPLQDILLAPYGKAAFHNHTV